MSDVTGLADPEVRAAGARPRNLPARSKPSAKHQTHRTVRWLHVYTSMACLVVVLFFGITGITLNHPSWTFGQDAVRETFSGTLPDGFLATDGDVDFLAATEFVRNTHGVKGTVEDYGVSGTDATVSFKAPGYAADLFFETSTGSYDVTIEQDGFVAVMNDLHKGRYADSSWRWLIDIAGGLLVVISLTGLGIQFFLRKRRTKAFVIATLGGLATVALIVVTMA